MKHTLCIAVAFLLLFGCLLADIKAQDAVQATETIAQEGGEKAEEPKQRDPVQLVKVTVVIEGEALKQEGIHEWAGKAAQLVVEWYPIFDKIFATDGFVPGNEITLVFRKMDGVAFASGSTVTISADWIRRSPEDFGMVAHEMIHAVQRYPGGRGSGGIPGWAMEGITDFARHAYYEPDVLMRPVNLERAKHTDSYQITGGFFMWIEHVYDKEFVKKLNEHARRRTWSDEVFEKSTGKNVETLWGEYIAFLRKIEGTRILPSRDFNREKLGNTYSVAPPAIRRTGRQQAN